MRLLIIAHLPAAALLALGHPLTSFAALFAAHLFLLVGTLIPSTRFFGPVVTSFQPSDNELWLTFDDGPSPETTPATLDLLDAHGARATFFLIGNLATAHPGLVRSILDRGHTIANHTQSHPAKSFWRLPPTRIHNEIATCQQTLSPTPRLFRAPAGMKNPFVHPCLKKLGLHLIGWSARGFDGSITNPDRILARILPQLHPGAIVLLHEGRPTTLECTRRLLEALDKQNLTCQIPLQYDQKPLGTSQSPNYP